MLKKSERIKVLFLCTGNSCRSQMAEGWTRFLLADIIEPFSAGIEPKSLDPSAVEVMAEKGVDISKHRSKHIDELKDIQFNYVITVCGHADEHCPIFAGKTVKIHYGFEDPPKLAANAKSKGEALDYYRKVRNLIEDFVRSLPRFLAIHSAGG